jgi:hypothetical protein
MPTCLDINVRQLTDELSDADDEGLAGVYRVDFHEEAHTLPAAKAAAVALDVFHENWGIGCLDDFEITVLDAQGAPISPDPDHEDYSGSGLGMVDKISDEPAVLGSAPTASVTPPMADIELCILGAQAHGQNSDPDHEVGDLQDGLREMWELLTPEQRQRFMERPSVRERLDNELPEALVAIAYRNAGYGRDEPGDGEPAPKCDIALLG